MAASASVSYGAVIYSNIAASIERSSLTSKSISFDLNKDSRIDFSLTATGDVLGGEYILVDSAENARFVYTGQVMTTDFDLFKVTDFAPLDSHFLVGTLGETATFKMLNLSMSGLKLLASQQLTPSPNPGEGLFVGKTAYLGFSFESNLGTHYGYALLTDTTSLGTTILETAWESEPDTPILTGAVPEPSAALLSMCGAMLLGFRRKRP